MAFNLEHQRSPVWLERAEAAVALLNWLPVKGSLRVADIGCGDAKLEAAMARLPRPWTWTGFDLAPQDSRVQWFDVRESRLPKDAYDVAVLLGLLAYMEDMEAVLEGLSTRVPHVLFSYSFPHSSEPVPGWVTPWRTRAQVSHIVQSCGFDVIGKTACADGQVELWLCRSPGIWTPA